MRKGLIVAAIHLAFVGSLGAKLLIDRATRPRVWVRTGPVDPDLPIRGRYVQLRIAGRASEVLSGPTGSAPVTLRVDNGVLWFDRVAESTGSRIRARTTITTREGEHIAELNQPVAYFIPEHVPDPSRRAAGEELWVEVTLPKKGSPRPIRLGVKKGGVLTPLDLD
jgi:uncharacterized membrane-anchored protein